MKRRSAFDQTETRTRALGEPFPPKEPPTKTFADVCDGVRVARRAHMAANTEVDRLKRELEEAEKRRKAALDAEYDAQDELNSFIDRETAVD